MTRKQTETADVADLDHARDERRQLPNADAAAHVPIVANPQAAAITFFDGVLAYNFADGGGSITLAAKRQMVDTAGRAFEDRIVTAILKAPLQALQQLKLAIDDIERRAHDEVAAAVAAVQRPEGQMSH